MNNVYKFCQHCYALNHFDATRCEKCAAPLHGDGGESYLDKLIWALQHPERETVLRAITVLSMLGPGARVAASSLKAVFENETQDPYVRAAAVSALAKIMPDHAREFLLPHLEHPNIIIRQAIRKVLSD